MSTGRERLVPLVTLSSIILGGAFAYHDEIVSNLAFGFLGGDRQSSEALAIIAEEEETNYLSLIMSQYGKSTTERQADIESFVCDKLKQNAPVSSNLRARTTRELFAGEIQTGTIRIWEQGIIFQLDYHAFVTSGGKDRFLLSGANTLFNFSWSYGSGVFLSPANWSHIMQGTVGSRYEHRGQDHSLLLDPQEHIQLIPNAEVANQPAVNSIATPYTWEFANGLLVINPESRELWLYTQITDDTTLSNDSVYLRAWILMQEAKGAIVLPVQPQSVVHDMKTCLNFAIVPN